MKEFKLLLFIPLELPSIMFVNFLAMFRSWFVELVSFWEGLPCKLVILRAMLTV